jgi:hypothetical protein
LLPSRIGIQRCGFWGIKEVHVEILWRMLIKRSNGYIKITFRNVQEDEKNGTFEDVFALTGRKVLNTINSSFEFKNGKII